MMKTFSRTLHGYNPDEVNNFFDEIISHVEKIVESNKQKNVQIKKLQEELDKIKPNEDVIRKAQKFDELSSTLNKAIVMAEETGEHIRRVAREERDLMLEEAKKNASIIISDALRRSEKIEYEGALLRKNIASFKRKLRANLEEQLKMVDEIEILEDIQ